MVVCAHSPTLQSWMCLKSSRAECRQNLTIELGRTVAAFVITSLPSALNVRLPTASPSGLSSPVFRCAKSLQSRVKIKRTYVSTGALS